MAYVYGYSDMSSDEYSYESYGYFTGTSVNNMEDVAYIPDEIHQYTSNDMLVFDREIRSEFTSVNWRLNGKDIAAAGQNLLAYLTDQEYRTDRIAIELNGTIIPRRDYDKVTLKDGDSMEIVHFVGGG